MSASPRWTCPRACRSGHLPVRPGLTVALFLLVIASASGCASARRLVAPAPLIPQETVDAMTAWVQATDSLQDVRFTPDAAIVTPQGEVHGVLAAESFANGTLEGSQYSHVALSKKRTTFACDDDVVIVEGVYVATMTDSLGSYSVKGPYLLRAIVDANGRPLVNLVRLSTTRGVRVGAMAGGCDAPSAYRFAGRRRGIAVFGFGWPLQTAKADAAAELEFADWTCSSSSACSRAHDSAGAGPFVEAYTRLRPGWGVQILGGRLWGVGSPGYRFNNFRAQSGSLTLHNNIDILGATLYAERRNFRVAAGPAVLRSSWSFDANISKADSLGFNVARVSALKPALLGAATFMLPFGSHFDVELSAVGEIAGSVTPPSLLEFQPDPINTSAVTVAIGLGIRP